MNGQGTSRDGLEKGLRVLARIIARKLIRDRLNGRQESCEEGDTLFQAAGDLPVRERNPCEEVIPWTFFPR